MDHISGSLDKRLNQRLLATTATASYVCHVAETLAAGRFRAISFRRGTLTLACDTTGAAQDLMLERVALTQAINATLPSPLVTQLRVITRRVQDR